MNQYDNLTLLAFMIALSFNATGCSDKSALSDDEIISYGMPKKAILLNDLVGKSDEFDIWVVFLKYKCTESDLISYTQAYNLLCVPEDFQGSLFPSEHVPEFFILNGDGSIKYYMWNATPVSLGEGVYLCDAAIAFQDDIGLISYTMVIDHSERK